MTCRVGKFILQMEKLRLKKYSNRTLLGTEAASYSQQLEDEN